MCKGLLRQTPQQAESRDELRQLLDRPSGGVIFTTIQKFLPKDDETVLPPVTERRNVVVTFGAGESGERIMRRGGL